MTEHQRYLELWAAVIRAHIHAYLAGKHACNSYHGRLLRLEGERSRAWLYSDDPTFPSFVGVCDALGLEPGYIRRRIEQESWEDWEKRWTHPRPEPVPRVLVKRRRKRLIDVTAEVVAKAKPRPKPSKPVWLPECRAELKARREARREVRV